MIGQKLPEIRTVRFFDNSVSQAKPGNLSLSGYDTSGFLMTSDMAIPKTELRSKKRKSIVGTNLPNFNCRRNGSPKIKKVR